MPKKLIIILTILISIILSGCGIAPDPLEPEQNGIAYRALLVGVGDYANFSFPVDLKSPKYNVDKMEEILQFCEITELVDLDATKKAILSGILSVFAENDDNDISYFYWSGHGGARIEPHILPTDTHHTPETWISVNELENLFDNIKGTKVIIMDTCFSGAFIDKSYDFMRAFNKDNYYVLTSCKGDGECKEFVYADPPYGVFTMGFYQGYLSGITTLKDMCSYIRDWVKENHPSHSQIAQCYPEGSDFVIIDIEVM